jgi:hypothetical protein
MKKQIVLISLFFVLFYSCQNNKSAINLFKDKSEKLLFSKSIYFEKDSLASPYLILKVDSFIIVHDVYDMKHFTVFNSNSGKFVNRFGNIGVGPGEILIGNVLSVYQGNLFSFDIPRSYIFKYDLNAITNDISYTPKSIAKFEFVEESHFSRILSLSDSCFIGGGVYKTKFQNVLLNKQGKVIDYGIDIFNSQESFEDIYKFLSNQGILMSHPSEEKFVYSVFNSSNIDFFEIRNGKLNLMKSYRLNNPKFQNEKFGSDSFSINYDKSSKLGYLDIATTDNYVYALYTDKQIISNELCSNVILVFDWGGNPIVKYILDKDVYYITVDETDKQVYAILKEDDGDWIITSFNIIN